MSKKVQIGGTVEGVKFSPFNSELFKKAFAQFDGKQCTVTVSKFENSRTVQQNRYMYGVVFQCMADESDCSIGEVHDRMCQLNLPPIVTENKKLGAFLSQGKTSELSTVEMNIFLEKCRAFAASFLGIEIPLPPYKEDEPVK